MAKQKPETKLCKHCKTEIPYDAKVCPNCRKKVKGGVLKWAVIAVVVFIVIAAVAGGDDDSESSNGVTKIGTVGEESTAASSSDDISDGDSDSNSDSEDVGNDDTSAEGTVQTEYYVGDILLDGSMKIVYMASGVYVEENKYSQPDEGYQYIYLQFAFENTSDDSDDSISFYSFDAYADGYSVDMYYGGDDDLSATLSAGRSTTGCVYFTVPEDAEKVEVEYTTNYFTEDKITFVYEGEKDSGYEVEKITTATEGAYVVGDIISVGDLTITYISCEEDESDNMYIQPADGYHYVTCTFEFENTGDDDEYISCYSFDCYADGMACSLSYWRDDVLSATISSGHKAKGTVTFEVPDDASVVEFEYLTNYWTSSRVVFECE